jgi:hypothetical protein
MSVGRTTRVRSRTTNSRAFLKHCCCTGAARASGAVKLGEIAQSGNLSERPCSAAPNGHERCNVAFAMSEFQTKIPDSEVTPPALYFNRRKLMRAGALAATVAGTGWIYRRLNTMALTATDSPKLPGLVTSRARVAPSARHAARGPHAQAHRACRAIRVHWSRVRRRTARGGGGRHHAAHGDCPLPHRQRLERPDLPDFLDQAATRRDLRR